MTIILKGKRMLYSGVITMINGREKLKKRFIPLVMTILALISILVVSTTFQQIEGDYHTWKSIDSLQVCHHTILPSRRGEIQPTKGNNDTSDLYIVRDMNRSLCMADNPDNKPHDEYNNESNEYERDSIADSSMFPFYNERDFEGVRGECIPGQISVKFKGGVSKRMIKELNLKYGCSVLSQLPITNSYLLSIPAGESVSGMLMKYLDESIVEYAQANHIGSLCFVPNDHYYSYQWHLSLINMEQAWDIEFGGDPSVIVAVLDSGIAYEDYDGYYQAPDLINTSFVPGFDFINFDSHPNDDHGHGTHVAGTIAQTTHNDYGVAGIAFKTSIMPIKVLDSEAHSTDVIVALGIRWAADNGADVISMSLSFNSSLTPEDCPYLTEAVQYAYSKGVILVAASGNDGGGVVSLPAAYSEVIAVGAIHSGGERANYSQYGTMLDVVAPGGDPVDRDGNGYIDGILQETFNLETHDPEDFGFFFSYGTSSAASHVSGVIALLLAQNHTRTQNNIHEILQTTSIDVGDPGWDNEYGYGLINAAAALKAFSKDEYVYQWNKTWAGPNNDSAGGIALDFSDNIYIVGDIDTSEHWRERDIFLVKSNSSGVEQWTRKFNWGWPYPDYGKDVAVDSSGYICIVGNSKDYSTKYASIILIKYNNAGGLHDSVVSCSSTSQYAYGLAIDSSDNIYVGGVQYNSETSSFDILLVKYNSSLTKEWSKTWGGGSDDYGWGVTVDSSDDIYVVGHTYSFGVGGSDMCLVKYNSSGVLLWDKIWGGSDYDYGWGVAVDSSDNIYVTGDTNSSGFGSEDMCLVKYNSSGVLLWSQTWGRSDLDTGYGVTVDSSDNIYVVGHTYSFGVGGSDMCLVKYDSSGTQLWHKTWGGSDYDYGWGVAVDSSDNIYVTGGTESFGFGNEDIFLVKYSRVPTNHIPVIKNPVPINDATEVSINPNLSIDVYDVDKNLMTVNFYDASDDSLIGTDIGVSNDETASVTWPGLSEGTSYEWYVVVSDGKDSITSPTWAFSTYSDPPIWEHTLLNQIIEFGEELRYNLNASDTSGIDNWWTNNTNQFSISVNGVLTNATILPVGEYWLEVRAYDPYDNFCQATMKLIVQDTINPTWDVIISHQLIEHGNNFWYNLNASDLSGIAHWWTNDTDQFPITIDGVLTNATILPVGEYWLEIRAYDPYDNFCTATMKLIVQDTINPTWDDLQSHQLVDYGNSFWYDLNASDFSGIAHWWTNDTDQFSITIDGVLTNASILPVGEYWLEVRAYDPYDNFCKATIIIVVQDHILSKLTILSPNGGEHLSKMVIIQWTRVTDSLSHEISYTVYYSADGGSTWNTIIANLKAGTYKWNTTTVADGSCYLIQVNATCSYGLWQVDISDNMFAIVNEVTVTTTTAATLPTSTTIYSSTAEAIVTTPPSSFTKSISTSESSKKTSWNHSILFLPIIIIIGFRKLKRGIIEE